MNTSKIYFIYTLFDVPICRRVLFHTYLSSYDTEEDF